jgi:hypothetical protein
VINKTAMAFSGGTGVSLTTPAESHSIHLNEIGSAELDWSKEPAVSHKAAAIQYDTYGGEDHSRDASHISMTLQ